MTTRGHLGHRNDRRKSALQRMENRLKHPVPEGKDKRVKSHKRTEEQTQEEIKNLRKKIVG